MKKYETRRSAREERLKRREAKLASAMESCEEKLTYLTIEHQGLLRKNNEEIASDRSPPTTSKEAAEDLHNKSSLSPQTSASHGLDKGTERRAASKSLHEKHAALAFQAQEGGWTESNDGVHGFRPIVRVNSRLFISKPKVDQGGPQHTEAEECPHPISTAAQTPSIDIWTHGIQESLVDDTIPVAEGPEHSDFSLLQQETHDALKEINQNIAANQRVQTQSSPHRSPRCESNLTPSVWEPPDQKPALSSAVRRMHSRRLTLASPRPSLLNFASNPVNPEISHTRPDTSHSWAASPSSMLLTETRTSTMSSNGGRLPADRAEAARKRLEARKRGKRS